MMNLRKIARYAGRSHLTMILVIILLLLSFISFHSYQTKRSEHVTIHINPSATDKPLLPSPPKDSKPDDSVQKTGTTNSRSPADRGEQPMPGRNTFYHYTTDEHLLTLLRQQANSLGQVIVTITGGDSYSLFIWDWYERMLEVSNTTNKCHCFVIAMDEIAVILAVQQNIPVYYSTFSFDNQMQWINTMEARQHSLYRVGHAKFDTTARILRLGYSVILSELDVFWSKNLLDYLKAPADTYELQISHHYGAHPRVNIGLFYARSSNASVAFFSYVAEFWLRFGKGGYLSDQRALDALLSNYDRLDKTYLKAYLSSTPLKLNWTTHDFGNNFAHFMTDGSAFVLFNQAAKVGRRAKKFYGGAQSKFFTVAINDGNMPISRRNLLIRALLILQQTQLQNRTLIIPAFTSNLTVTPIIYQLDIKKFLIYWSEERVRLPDFLELSRNQSLAATATPYVPKKTFDDVPGLLNFTQESIPLDLPAPSPQFEVHVRDSLLWCSPPLVGGYWCFHHPRDYGATMEILFACRGDPYPPCANKTEKNEQFLERPYEKP